MVVCNICKCGIDEVAFCLSLVDLFLQMVATILIAQGARAIGVVKFQNCSREQIKQVSVM